MLKEQWEVSSDVGDDASRPDECVQVTDAENLLCCHGPKEQWQTETACKTLQPHETKRSQRTSLHNMSGETNPHDLKHCPQSHALLFSHTPTTSWEQKTACLCNNRYKKGTWTLGNWKSLRFKLRGGRPTRDANQFGTPTRSQAPKHHGR